MHQDYSKSIKPILDVYDKVREVLRNEEIELPKIVVVGDQSSGKSSVLESITKIALPRGENTVTKCPIIIQLRECSFDEQEIAFVREQGEKIENVKGVGLEQLSTEIAEAQRRLIEKEKVEISDKPLYVNVNMHGAPNLTLFDLPGITYKKEELTENIKRIIEKYTSGSSTLILMAIPSNSDFTTSEAISLVRKNKDFKDRTLAVITKIDLGIQADKKIFEKIKNNELGLAFEPIVVRNRTQEELENNLNIDDVKRKELNLIEGHKELKNLPDETKGTDKLIKRLVFMQRKFLLESCRPIKEKILDKKSELLKEQRKLPAPAYTTSDKMERFKECLNILQNDFSQKLKGKGNSSNVDDKKFNILSRMKEKFDNSIIFLFTKRRDFFYSQRFFDQLKENIDEAKGIKLSNFIDPEIFNDIIKIEIQSVSENVFCLLEDSKKYMNMIFEKIVSEAFQNFPRLKDAIIFELKESLTKQGCVVEDLTNALLECEMDCVYTINPSYEHNLKELQNKKSNFQNSKEPIPAEFKFNESTIKYKESVFSNFDTSERINHLLNLQYSCISYWSIFEKRFSDYYHKLILNKLIFYYSNKNNLGLLLEKKFAPNNGVDQDWIIEDLSITKQRENISESLQNLEKALKELNKIG